MVGKARAHVKLRREGIEERTEAGEAGANLAAAIGHGSWRAAIGDEVGDSRAGVEGSADALVHTPPSSV